MYLLMHNDSMIRRWLDSETRPIESVWSFGSIWFFIFFRVVEPLVFLEAHLKKWTVAPTLISTLAVLRIAPRICSFSQKPRLLWLRSQKSPPSSSLINCGKRLLIQALTLRNSLALSHFVASTPGPLLCILYFLFSVTNQFYPSCTPKRGKR